jgi:hypothetical protein
MSRGSRPCCRTRASVRAQRRVDADIRDVPLERRAASLGAVMTARERGDARAEARDRSEGEERDQ